IWAGMSGSPVYAADGRLIGAVAYSLSLGPSPIAGVTPAADMYQILTRPGAAAAKPASMVALPAAIKQRLVASGAATATQASAGMHLLPVPLGISGVNQAHLDAVSQRLRQKIPGVQVYAAGASPATPGSPSDIFPGSNFAAAISYGDLTAAGIGTTTAVCPGGQVLAFGHPFLFSGASSMSVHTAEAVYVQPDPTLSGFKVANPGGVVGALDQDRLAGIRGRFGAAPPFIPISSDVTSLDNGTMRSATTNLNVPEFVPDIAAFHLLGNLDRVADRVGGGTAEIRWTIEGRRA